MDSAGCAPGRPSRQDIGREGLKLGVLGALGKQSPTWARQWRFHSVFILKRDFIQTFD